MISDINSYTNEGKKEIIRSIIEQKLPMQHGTEEYNNFFSEAVSMLSNYIKDKDIIDLFELYEYRASDYLLSEAYDGRYNYFFVILEGTAACTLQEGFISYKTKGDILGSIGLAYSTYSSGPCASIVAVSKRVVAARLLLTENIRVRLRNDLIFMQKISRDLADIVRENNVYYLMRNSRPKMLAAYIKIKMTEVQKGVYLWAPKKSEVVKELSLFDNSQLNSVIKALKEKGILTVNEIKKSRANTYYVNNELLEAELVGIDINILTKKYLKE